MSMWGSLFDYIDRHYNHGDDTYPLAHNPVMSHYVSGPVRFPLDLRLYRRIFLVKLLQDMGEVVFERTGKANW